LPAVPAADPLRTIPAHETGWTPTEDEAGGEESWSKGDEKDMLEGAGSEMEEFGKD